MEVVTTGPAPPTALQPDRKDEPTEVLFPEAKRRERIRRLIIPAVVSVVLGGTGIGYAVSNSSAPPTRPATTSPASTAQPTAPTTVGEPLKAPYGLVVAPNGDLYIVDTGRDQVLRRLPSGKFQVVAGDGHRGFSGDGGPATSAELNVGDRSAIAVAKDGTLFIADSGNERVRAVLPDGIIKTVAGDGNSRADHGLILRTTPALDASLGEVEGLAIGPNGDLYIAASNVVRLTPEHTIEWVAGNNTAFACGSVFCNPASEPDFVDPDQLAFDGSGDLFVSGSSYGLFEIAAKGHLEYLGQARGDGASEALAEAPNGTVVQAGRNGLTRLPANGKIKLPKPEPQGFLAPGEGIPGNLDHALGRHQGMLGGYNFFFGGDGVAVGSNGAIYADTNTGNTVTAVSALLEVMPDGKVLTIWKS
jgi:hypothetical protein